MSPEVSFFQINEEIDAEFLPFMRILVEMANLHMKKSFDYGTASDPYANVRASKDFSIPPWVGALVRQNDKLVRLKSFLKKGSVANESVRDSLIDNAVYAAIALVLYDNSK